MGLQGKAAYAISDTVADVLAAMVVGEWVFVGTEKLHSRQTI
jgi:hypothetical protein